MRVKSSYLVAGGILAVLVVLFTLGTLFTGGEAPADKAEAKTAPTETLPTVQVSATPEQRRNYVVSLRGRTEAARAVIVRAETAGVVASTPTPEGSLVRRGAVLCRQEVDARQASLDQARAALRSRELQHKASMELAAKGYRSQTQVLQDQANLDAASAAARQAEIALEQINIRAPFAGVFDRREAEVGAYLAPGQPCGTMIELNPLMVIGDVPETEAARVRAGAAATATLVSGETLSGRVRFVARDADPQTRTYRVEVAVGNPGLRARSGQSADLQISAGAGVAHLVPVSALVLDSEGRQGVRHVTAGDQVAFAPVRVLEETPEGIWVSGLSGDLRVITVGQSYVDQGQKVKVVAAR